MSKPFRTFKFPIRVCESVGRTTRFHIMQKDSTSRPGRKRGVGGGTPAHAAAPAGGSSTSVPACSTVALIEDPPPPSSSSKRRRIEKKGDENARICSRVSCSAPCTTTCLRTYEVPAKQGKGLKKRAETYKVWVCEQCWGVFEAAWKSMGYWHILVIDFNEHKEEDQKFDLTCQIQAGLERLKSTGEVSVHVRVGYRVEKNAVCIPVADYAEEIAPEGNPITPKEGQARTDKIKDVNGRSFIPGVLAHDGAPKTNVVMYCDSFVEQKDFKLMRQDCLRDGQTGEAFKVALQNFQQTLPMPLRGNKKIPTVKLLQARAAMAAKTLRRKAGDGKETVADECACESDGDASEGDESEEPSEVDEPIACNEEEANTDDDDNDAAGACFF